MGSLSRAIVRTLSSPRRSLLRHGAGGILTLGAALLIPTVISGCDERATPTQCSAACENVKALYLVEVDTASKRHDVLKKMGETGAKMAQEMANLQLDYIREQCEKVCKTKATTEQANCLAVARSTQDLDKCN